MSFKYRSISFLTAVFSVAVFASFATAQEVKPAAPTEKADKAERVFRGEGRGKFGREFGRKHGRMGGRHGMMRMFHGLDLTEAQKAQIKSIREANKPDRALMEEVRAIRESRKAGTDLTAEQKARLNAIHDQMRVKGQNVHDQIQAILTAEQKAKIETRKAEMKTRMQERRLRRDKAPVAAPADKPKEN